MTIVRRTTVGWLVATVLALVASTVGLARPAGAADGRCDGVWVVVDARALGGELTTRCAEGDPTSGLEALTLTGHTYGFVPRQPGMVCTIDARPDPCNGAPTDAYWGYFHAEAGGQWEYSTYGAGNRDPEPGSVEGWAFGEKARPGRRPPSNASAPPPTPTPAETASPEPTVAPTAEPTAAPSAPTASEPPAVSPSDDTGDRSTAAAVAPTEAAPSAARSPRDASEAPDAPSETADSDAAPLADATATDAVTDSDADSDTDDAEGPIGLVVGGVLFAGLAGAAVLRSRRRDDGQV